MKLIHISDIHIHTEPILGNDPVANFKACMDHISRTNGDADLVIISGDLTHHGKASAYAALKKLLQNWTFSPLLMMGNHDNRENFLTAFPETETDRDGYIQYVRDTPAGRFLVLDTAEAGTHAGHFDIKRQSWLLEQLAKALNDGERVYLVMHHNPTEVGIANADNIGLRDGVAFRQILTEFRDNIEHIFFGHCHYVLSGSVCGIAFSAPCSTSHPCVPDFSGLDRMGYGDLSPTYNVCLLNEHSTVIHSIDFLLENTITWTGTNADGWVQDGTTDIKAN